MISKEKESKSLTEIDSDVCVVGSGAGGAVVAKELAESGLRVVVLEKGERLTKYDFTQKEREIFPRVYEDAGMRATEDQSIIILHAKGVGGTTLVNDNICFRASRATLTDWRDLGIEKMGPDEMASYYENVEQEISVAPIRDEEVSRNDWVLHQGALRLGLHPRRFKHNRNDCIGCGFCYCGCAYDRKRNMTLTYLPKAEAAGAQIFANNEAKVIQRTGSKITAVIASERDPQTRELKREVAVRAKIYVLAGGGISTPSLLLKNGFGRFNPNVGRHLSLHPILGNVGLMPERIRFYEGIPQCEYVDCLSEEEKTGFLLEGIGAHPILISLCLPSFGFPHGERMREYDRFSIHYIMVRDRPQGEIRVSRNGALSVRYRFHPRDWQSVREGMKLSARVYFAAGAEKVYLNHSEGPVLRGEKDLGVIDRLPLEPNRMVFYSAHQLSSCRMGPDPRTSVTDSFGKVHGMENLFIADASLFPTSIGYNPQLTIMALALRNSEAIVRHLV